MFLIRERMVWLGKDKNPDLLSMSCVHLQTDRIKRFCKEK
jgi:hypothetical protein